EVGGVAELDLVFVDPDVDRRLRYAVDDDGVPAGLLDLGAPEAAGLGLAEATRERGLRADRVPAGAGDRRAGDDARGEDDDVVRAERVGALRDVLQEVMGDEAAPAGVAPVEGVARLLDPCRPLRQVDVQDLVPVAVP